MSITDGRCQQHSHVGIKQNMICSPLEHRSQLVLTTVIC